MANPWFRMYHEFATDPKIQMLNEADQRRFVMLLCLRCCNGSVTLHDEHVAFQLRISNEEWLETKSILLQQNLVDKSNNPPAWDKRQFESDSSTTRVQRHRQKQKEEKERPCNVTGTASDTDTDTDTEITARFAPPSEEDVQGQIDKLGYDHVAADAFVNFYGSKNWMIGKNKMADWRKALGGWESKNKAKELAKGNGSPGAVF